MKKLLYSVLALAGILAMSCNKEVEAPQAGPEKTGKTHTVTLKAAFATEGETRTTYANNKTFSWVAGDIVYVRCLNEETNYWYWAAFVAESTGATTNLTGEVDDGYEPYDVAVYVPGENYVGSAYYNESTVRVVAPISYHLDGFGLGVDSEGDATPYWNSVSVPSDNPLSVLPLISVTKDDVLYFQTGEGVLNVNLTDVPAEATHIRITAPDKYLGNYLMVQEGEIRNDEPWVYQEEGEADVTYAVSYMEYYFQPASDGTASLLVPLPIGTMDAGTKIEVLDAEDKVLFSKTTKKAITITRNKITQLVSLSAKVDWVSLGTGLFGDHYSYNPDYDVEVEIQQNAAEPTQFRLVDPYAGYRELIEYEATGDEIGPDPYLYFRILQKGEKVNGVTVTRDDLVFFDAYYTGIVNDNYGVDPFLGHPSRWGSEFPESQWARSIVVKYQSDGVTPANVQLAPVFFWLTDPDAGSGYWSGDNYLGYNNLIEIRFPGAERVDLEVSLSYVEIVDSDPAQAVALVDFACSNVITGAKVVIAANETDAIAALADASRYTAVTESGELEVKLPANAPSGDYYIYAQTTVTDQVTPACAQLVVSDKFKYFNANTNLGYTLDDVIGSYSADDYYYLNSWVQTTLTMVVEESDDPLSGDIKITSVCPQAIDRYGQNLYNYGLYGSFDTATGEIIVPAGQVIAHNVPNDIDWTVADYPATKDLHLILTEPGHILNEGNYCFYAGSYGLQCYSNANVEFIRTSSNSAPALSARNPRGTVALSGDVRMGSTSFAPATPKHLAK